MAKRTPDEVYAALLQAGFGHQAAIIMTAIAGAESGWDDTSLGDVALQNDEWGPSYGLFQIRTKKAQTGTGGWRDIAWLTGSNAHQAQAAYQISKQGTDYSPWTVYNTGAYQQHLAAAQAAAGRVDPNGASGESPWWLNEWTSSWLPWVATGNPYEVGGAAAGSAVTELGELPGEWIGGALSGARHILIEGAAYLAGAAVIGLGLFLLAKRRGT